MVDQAHVRQRRHGGIVLSPVVSLRVTLAIRHINYNFNVLCGQREPVFSCNYLVLLGTSLMARMAEMVAISKQDLWCQRTPATCPCYVHLSATVNIYSVADVFRIVYFTIALSQFQTCDLP